jgi:hypothetical protein
MARYYRKKDGGYAGETTAWMELKREGSADRVYFAGKKTDLRRGIRSRQLGGLSHKNAPDFEMAAPHTFKGIEIPLDALLLTAK